MPPPPDVASSAPSTEPSTREAAAVAAELGTDLQLGLSAAEAGRRLARDGRNELRAEAPVPWWQRVLTQLRNPLVYLLLGAALVSLLAWWAGGTEGLPVDFIVILAVLSLNAVVGASQEARADDAVAELSAMTAPTATVLRDGAMLTVPSAEVVVGDVLLLAEGDAVAADARLLESTSLRVAEASLTGESSPVTKQVAPLASVVPLAERTTMVYQGTAVTAGLGRAVVTATGMSTEVGTIARLLTEAAHPATPLEREVARIAKVLGVIVIAIAVVVMTALVLVSDIDSPADLVDVLLLGAALAVAAVPEGLPAVLSLVLALGVRRLARHHAVVKELPSVEALGSADVICTDKTGTLTRNEMTVQHVVTASGEVTLSGTGYEPRGEVLTADGTRLADVSGSALHGEVLAVLTGAALANNAELHETASGWGIEGDPTEAALLVAAAKLPAAAAPVEASQRVGEAPFTSERKMMSVLEPDDAGGVRLVAKGAPDVLLERCSHRLQDGRAVALDAATREAVLARVSTLSGEALRCLAVAHRAVPRNPLPAARGHEAEGVTALESDLVLAGIVGMMDPPRPTAAAAVAEAARAGVRTVMITGDHAATAARIAADLGIARPAGRVVTGPELDEVDDDALAVLADEIDVYARVAPQHKTRIVTALEAGGRVVAMTGDGVNDAPALKVADIGIAMGSGTEVTKQAAAMVLADDDFATIVTAVRQGRQVFDNIQKFLRYLLSSNSAEVLAVFLGVVFAGWLGLTSAAPGVVLPLLATQLLWINLVTDAAPALALGADPPVDDVMARAPRRHGQRIVDAAMWRAIVVLGVVMALATLLAIDLTLPGGIIDGDGTLVEARTAGFTTLVLAQLFNALNSRSARTSAFVGIGANRWLWGAIGLGVVLQVAVVNLPVLQVAFGTAPLSLPQWAVAVALASTVLWVDEVRKLALRVRRR